MGTLAVTGIHRARLCATGSPTPPPSLFPVRTPVGCFRRRIDPRETARNRLFHNGAYPRASMGATSRREPPEGAPEDSPGRESWVDALPHPLRRVPARGRQRLVGVAWDPMPSPGGDCGEGGRPCSAHDSRRGLFSTVPSGLRRRPRLSSGVARAIVNVKPFLCRLFDPRQTAPAGPSLRDRPARAGLPKATPSGRG